MSETPAQLLQDLVIKNGGYVNAHAHLDRAFTITNADYQRAQVSLVQKWSLVDGVKQVSSQEDYYQRIKSAIETIRGSGTIACASFIDVDEISEDRALKAALRVKEELASEFPLQLANQTLKGVLDPVARRWFDQGAEAVDIIGGLPKRDAPNEIEHIDILLATAKRLGKSVHIHVDQFNDQSEHETESLARRTIEHGLEGRVWAVHSISLSAHPKPYRESVYKLLKEAGVGVIACPVAWIDAARSESQQPFHNAMTPVEELLQHEIPVALGTDNIADLYSPFGSGDMWLELKLAVLGCRMYGAPLEDLVAMATTNVRRAIGIDLTTVNKMKSEPAHAH